VLFPPCTMLEVIENWHTPAPGKHLDHYIHRRTTHHHGRHTSHAHSQSRMSQLRRSTLAGGMIARPQLEKEDGTRFQTIDVMPCFV
jgi:hypothetical protein